MFEANPSKTTNVINCTCSDCGCEVVIEIMPTSGGFGLKGGALFKCTSKEYLAKCPACYTASLKTDDNQKSEKKID